MIPKYHACFVLTGPSLSSRTNFIQLLGPIRFPYISIKTLQTKKEERSSNQPNQAPKSPPKHREKINQLKLFPHFFCFSFLVLVPLLPLGSLPVHYEATATAAPQMCRCFEKIGPISSVRAN